MNYQVNLPYPKPRVETENIEYAKILSQDYAGMISEDTAIHLYTYQAFVLSDQNPTISAVLHHIAIVEMKHLELLGETIKLLGIAPKYVTYSQDNIKHFWSSSSVNYTTSLPNMLKQDIKAETIAIENYISHKESINDKYIRELLDRIILDEQRHLEIFQQLYEQQKKLDNQ